MCVVLYSIGIKIKWQQNYIVIITNNILKFRQRPNEINTATEEVLNKKKQQQRRKDRAGCFVSLGPRHSTAQSPVLIIYTHGKIIVVILAIKIKVNYEMNHECRYRSDVHLDLCRLFFLSISLLFP